MRIRKINTDSRRNNLVFLYALLNAEKVYSMRPSKLCPFNFCRSTFRCGVCHLLLNKLNIQSPMKWDELQLAGVADRLFRQLKRAN